MLLRSLSVRNRSTSCWDCDTSVTRVRQALHKRHTSVTRAAAPDAAQVLVRPEQEHLVLGL
eukprot:1826471-Pyramimonas_sp.AAC.1